VPTTTIGSCTIFGNPQNPGGANGANHAAQSMALALAGAGAGACEIHLNRTLNSSMGCGGSERPDVLIKYPCGDVEICEVCSPTQSKAGQRAKVGGMRKKCGSPKGKDTVI
jgi:hypothetical protein